MASSTFNLDHDVLLVVTATARTLGLTIKDTVSLFSMFQEVLRPGAMSRRASCACEARHPTKGQHHSPRGLHHGSKAKHAKKKRGTYVSCLARGMAFLSLRGEISPCLRNHQHQQCV